MGAELVSACGVAHALDAADDDAVQVLELGTVSQPLKKFETVLFRHVKVDEDNGREREEGTVRVYVGAFEVLDCGGDVLNRLKRVFQECFCQARLTRKISSA